MCGCKDGTRAADPRPGTTQVLAPSTVSAKSQWVGAVPIGSRVAPAGVLEMQHAEQFSISRSSRGRAEKEKKKEERKRRGQKEGGRRGERGVEEENRRNTNRNNCHIDILYLFCIA